MPLVNHRVGGGGARSDLCSGINQSYAVSWQRQLGSLSEMHSQRRFRGSLTATPVPWRPACAGPPRDRRCTPVSPGGSKQSQTGGFVFLLDRVERVGLLAHYSTWPRVLFVSTVEDCQRRTMEHWQRAPCIASQPSVAGGWCAFSVWIIYFKDDYTFCIELIYCDGHFGKLGICLISFVHLQFVIPCV